MTEAPFFTVSSLNFYVKRLFDNEKSLHHLHLKGEISNYKVYPSGHAYFSLKDNEAQIQAVMFKGERQNLTFIPKDGDEVIIVGSISLYPASGKYQINVEEMEIYGLGLKLLELEKLKKKLEQEGLFSLERKRVISPFSQSIGVITGDHSAAEKDITENIARRNPLAKIYLFPSLVQGEKAPNSLLNAISRARSYQLDLLIIARGGGSKEDLWAFNGEKVVRALADFPYPIISAVGHEIDTTLVDYVADKRVSTPTGAAEAATFDRHEIEQSIDQSFYRLQASSAKLLRLCDQEYSALKKHFVFLQKEPYHQWEEYIALNRNKLRYLSQNTIDHYGHQINILSSKITPDAYLKQIDFLITKNQLAKSMLIKTYGNKLSDFKQRISFFKEKFDHLPTIYFDQLLYHLNIDKEKLTSLSPLAVLKRGYAVVTKNNDELVKDINNVTIGEVVQIRLQNGKITSVIASKEIDHGEQ